MKTPVRKLKKFKRIPFAKLTPEQQVARLKFIESIQNTDWSDLDRIFNSKAG